MTPDDGKNRASLFARDIASRYRDVDKHALLGMWLMVRGIDCELPHYRMFRRAARQTLGRELPTGGMITYNLSVYLRPRHPPGTWTAEIVTLEDPDLIGTPWDDLQHEMVALMKQRFRQWGFPKGDRL